jgi:hypothetical protein
MPANIYSVFPDAYPQEENLINPDQKVVWHCVNQVWGDPTFLICPSIYIFAKLLFYCFVQTFGYMCAANTSFGMICLYDLYVFLHHRGKDKILEITQWYHREDPDLLPLLAGWFKHISTVGQSPPQSHAKKEKKKEKKDDGDDDDDKKDKKKGKKKNNNKKEDDDDNATSDDNSGDDNDDTADKHKKKKKGSDDKNDSDNDDDDDNYNDGAIYIRESTTSKAKPPANTKTVGGHTELTSMVDGSPEYMIGGVNWSQVLINLEGQLMNEHDETGAQCCRGRITNQDIIDLYGCYVVTKEMCSAKYKDYLSDFINEVKAYGVLQSLQGTFIFYTRTHIMKYYLISFK